MMIRLFGLIIFGLIIATAAVGKKAHSQIVGGPPNPSTLMCQAVAPSGQITYAPCNIVPGIPFANQVSANASGTTGAITATLSGVAGKTTYLCGFLMTSGGTTTPVTAQGTITGLAGGTQSVAYTAATSQGVLGAAFPACLPSATTNTSIAVTQPAGGTGTQAESLWIWGFIQ